MTVEKPPITWVGTNGYNTSPGAHPALAVVIHIMSGTLAGCDSWFSNPSAQASANFGIGKRGEIHGYVDPFAAYPYWAWANGNLLAPDATVQALVARGKALYGNVSPNVYTVSIETEGESGEVPTEAMFEATAQLTAYCCERWAIPPDRTALLGHYQFDSVNRPGCPGWSAATWERFVGRVAEWLYPPAPVDPTLELRKYCADAADRLYKAKADVDAALESLELPPGLSAAEINEYAGHAEDRIVSAQGHLAKAQESLTW